MTRTIAFALAATLASMPAFAFQDSGDGAQPEQPAERGILDRILDRVLGPEETTASDDGTPPELSAEPGTSENRLQTILSADFRSEDRARDRYRHPAQTLRFMGVRPNQTVIEFGPGGGWYTRVLAPYIAAEGRYIAMNADSAAFNVNAEQRRNLDRWASTFPGRVEQWTGIPASRVMAFESDDAPESLAGTVDRILIFRALHGMRNNGIADTELRRMRTLLADDGLIGVVQHRAPATETWERSNGSRGYLRQADVVKLFELNGFELVQTSEVNANPNDPANWERGVWTLPPVLALGEDNRAQYQAIGESDRMTLTFRKAR